MALCTQLTGDLQKRQQIDKKKLTTLSSSLILIKKKHLANFWFAKIENVFTNG